MNHVQSVRTALLERAHVLGITGRDEEAVLDTLLEREVQALAPSIDECRAYYDTHRDDFRVGALAELDHILFAVTDKVPVEALRERAQAALEALRQDDRGFADLARQLSNCPSAELGGNLGQVASSDVVPEFWRAVQSHGRPGVLPQLVESRFGLHIVRIARLDQGRPVPFELAVGEIETQLAERNLRVALHQYVHGLMHADCNHDHDHHGHQHGHHHEPRQDHRHG